MVTVRATGHFASWQYEPSNAKSTTRGGQAKIWEHNVESSEKLLKEVGVETATKVGCEGSVLGFGNHTRGEDKPLKWHWTKEHGIVTFIATWL
jgi:hypothetical protein